MTLRRRTAQHLALAGIALVALLIAGFWFFGVGRPASEPYRYVTTTAGLKGEFGEPFGIAVKGADLYVSDGQSGKVWLVKGDSTSVFAEGLDTPSGIAFDASGNLIVADAGSNTIKSIDTKGQITLVAGTEGHSGFADGDAAASLFNGPIGVAVGKEGKILVADTYNDRIRVIENGKVSTLAGSTFGFADGTGTDAKFETPCGLAVWQGGILVADAGNLRVRVVESDGHVWTLAGSGGLGLKDGLLASSSFVQPTAITVGRDGSLFIADGNAIRVISGDVIPMVRTISDETRGTRDGLLTRSRFNRPSGLVVDSSADLMVADSDNRLIRRISGTGHGHELTAEERQALRDKPEDFRLLQPPRWPYDPPDRVREIAGTLGELRGDIPEQKEPARFHNGLDIAGAYGETARSIRDEKILLPVAAADFGTLRESLRMPQLGYIHVRLGRDQLSRPFEDPRFHFERDASGKIVEVRVPRGTRFKAGEPVGTLNTMNHVHLIAGRSGFEMNALDALILPGLQDTRPPVIEAVEFFSDTGIAAAKDHLGHVQVSGKTRIVVRAYDQVDGNAARRRLGIYRAGYQLLRPDHAPLGDVIWTIRFDQMPRSWAAKLVYGDGSHSGATGMTIFNYIVTNHVEGDTAAEGFLDAAGLDDGDYILRAAVADQFGNETFADTTIEVKK